MLSARHGSQVKKADDGYNLRKQVKKADEVSPAYTTMVISCTTDHCEFNDNTIGKCTLSGISVGDDVGSSHHCRGYKKNY